MADLVYKVVEVVGTSNESISKAISRAISKAGATLRHLGWFEVVQIRGSIENDQIRQYQSDGQGRVHTRGRLTFDRAPHRRPAVPRMGLVQACPNSSLFIWQMRGAGQVADATACERQRSAKALP